MNERWAMTIKPTAADFECYVDGVLLSWNDPRGLDIRWLAANRALSASDQDLDDAATEITRLARGELQCGNVEVRRREIGSLCDG